MKRPLYSPPEDFALSPLLSLLPVLGKVGKLESLTSSLFARHEKVSALQREIGDEDRDAQRRFLAEGAMLKQVLDWLAVNPDTKH